MTTTDVIASTILALDLGKDKSAACDAILTSRAELLRRIDRRRPLLVGSRRALRWQGPQDSTELVCPINNSPFPLMAQQLLDPQDFARISLARRLDRKSTRLNSSH